MTVVASGLDGKLYDNTVPRFLYAGNGCAYDRLTAKLLSHASLVAAGLSAEIGARPAGNDPNFDFSGEGSAAPMTVTVSGIGTATVGLLFAGGPVNTNTVIMVEFDLAGSGAHITAPITLAVGKTASQVAALVNPACDALPDITASLAGPSVTAVCTSICNYAAVVQSSGETIPTIIKSGPPHFAADDDQADYDDEPNGERLADAEKHADAKPADKPKGKGKDKD